MSASKGFPADPKTSSPVSVDTENLSNELRTLSVGETSNGNAGENTPSSSSRNGEQTDTRSSSAQPTKGFGSGASLESTRNESNSSSRSGRGVGEAAKGFGSSAKASWSTVASTGAGLPSSADGAQSSAPSSHSSAAAAASSRSSDQNNTTVFVGSIPFEATEADIREFFEPCGTIISLKLLCHQATQRFKGSSFIRFETREGAQKACEKNGQNLLGRDLYISMSTSKPSTRQPAPEGCKTVFVGNLHAMVDEEALLQLLQSCGEVCSIKLIREKMTNQSKGFGFVEFATEEGTRKAVALNGAPLCDQPIKIDYQRPRPSTGRGRGSGGYGSDSSYRHAAYASAVAPGSYMQMPAGYPPHFYPGAYPMSSYYPPATSGYPGTMPAAYYPYPMLPYGQPPGPYAGGATAYPSYDASGMTTSPPASPSSAPGTSPDGAPLSPQQQQQQQQQQQAAYYMSGYMGQAPPPPGYQNTVPPAMLQQIFASAGQHPSSTVSPSSGAPPPTIT
eukprot:CAMPEP_0174231050 /NCGR_PEP_ID=MMETSP0417-20130205/1671_1 /TAXON_ID=242541 /ORGANISM="Mayorella sp, Strain BSH-02190019" /LENGTH=504 /DNA_ID=CAMNT_0015308857 /DNA_START=283 /DNA_END=1793 /DNA_ORIENTATION=+